MDSAHPEEDAATSNAVQMVTGIWSEVLGLQVRTIAPDDNFFAVGGDSLLIVQVMERINAAFFSDRPQAALPLTELFAHPTPRRLAQRLTNTEPAALGNGVHGAQSPATDDAIAIVGMAGRFPGAGDIDALWSNLCGGVESIRTFTNEQLLESGVHDAHLSSAAYVKRGACIDGIDQFDARYFGLSPREAALLCPQQRVLLECAEEALEHAGYGVRPEGVRVGVFLGTGRSIYLTEVLNSGAGFFDTIEGRLALVANTSSATRIAYLFDLTGPSFSIDTACSSSLVAVHQACLSLIRGECDLALAGGASITSLGPKGYRHEEGGIVSADGCCRPFDQDAGGTVFTSGAGIVLLRRLKDARVSADTIHAVIRGSAVNNDGKAKVGYTAPSQAGQARVIRSALRAAGVKPADIQYVETHGTGTALGDPIEVAALREVFDASAGVRCTLGAMKANVGHMEAAAGIGGLIKATCALARKQIPPAPNFRAINPRIDLASSGFSINTSLQDWSSKGGPRRAGVSSFGIGGTNAHVVLEEAPSLPVTRGDKARRVHLLPLSAKTPGALRRCCTDLAAYLQREDVPLADVAYTLQVGRAAHDYRTFIIAGTREEASERLLKCASDGVNAGRATGVLLALPGLSAVPATVLRDLYQQEVRFRQLLESAACHLHGDARHELLAWISTDAAPSESSPSEHCVPAAFSASALFVLQYALAHLLHAWGVESCGAADERAGACVEACVAGELGLGEALNLLSAGHSANLDVRSAPRARALATSGSQSAVLHVSPGTPIMTMLGLSWQNGGFVRWAAVNEGHAPRRVPLPTYPFERERHWIDRPRENRRPAEPIPDAAGATANGESAQEIEQAIAELWRQALGVDAVNPGDNFFELGGDSLMAVQLSTAMQARLGRPVALRQWIRQPTISGITQLLQDESRGAQ